MHRSKHHLYSVTSSASASSEDGTYLAARLATRAGDRIAGTGNIDSGRDSLDGQRGNDSLYGDNYSGEIEFRRRA
jgi:hypothetical protein